MKIKQILQSTPGSFSRERFRDLLKNGKAGAMVVNFSEYTYSFDSKVIHAVREIGAALERPVAVLLGVRGLPETERDFMDLEFGIKASLDYVLLPIISSAKEITALRAQMAKISSRKIPIIAGVDNARAAAQLKLILKAADGVMLDPSDIIIPPGLPLEPDSIIMKDPQQKMLNEDFYRGKIWLVNHRANKRLVTIAQTLLNLAEQVDARVIAVGKLELARQFSWLRPAQTIVLASRDDRELNQAAMLWGVEPLALKGDLTAMFKARGLVDNGQRFVDATQKSAGSIESIA